VIPSTEAGSNLDCPPGQKMAAGEVLLLCCSVVSLITSCILWSSRKQAWMDEIFTWKEVSDRSLWHLYSAIQHGADGGQPLFYTTVWLWAKAFGSGVLALRLYSSVAMCAALLVTWRTIRRYYGVWATAFGVLTIWGTSGTLLEQNAEARFYGLYILAVAVTINLYTRLVARPEPSRLLLVLAFFSQAALVLTHVLGLIYSGLILLVLILSDTWKRQLRLKVYLSYAAGWLALVVWLPAIRASMAAGKPHGWIPLPRLGTVLNSYFFQAYLEWLAFLQLHSSDSVFEVARWITELSILVPLCIVVWMTVRRILDRPALGSRHGNPLLPVAFALLAVPIVLYLLSHLITPVFVPRYALPSGIGMAIILTAFADAAGADRQSRLRWARLLWTSLIALLVISPVGSALVLRPPQVNAQYMDVQRIDSLAPPSIPLVVGWQNDFSILMRFSRYPQNRFFLLDWPTALAGGKGFVLDYHLMSAFRNAGYYPRNLQDQDAFLCSHSDFMVLDPHFFNSSALEPGWFDMVIRNKPQFEWKVVDSIAAPELQRTLIAVHRRAQLPFCIHP
jgi:hypothetical protein